MSYYVGGNVNLNDILGEGNPRYFYGLRREDDGTLYFTRNDQIGTSTAITLNVAGSNANNFENFEYGVDFFDGRLATDHSRPYPNLYFDQYRWDSKNCFYYLDQASGQLIVRINQSYTYSASQIISA
jgi:hypothetical protein